METSCEVEGTAYRRLIHVEEQQGGQGQPASDTASASDALSTCTANFPMLSPHEIATLILIAHTPGEVSVEWPDLQPLLSGNLVEINRCHACRGRPHVTSLGESLVVRFCKASRDCPSSLITSSASAECA